MRMHDVLQIVLNDKVQQIFDQFAASFGIVVIFYSIDGKVLRRGLNYLSPFCSLVQNQLAARKLCIKMDEEMCHRCKQSQNPVSYRCHAGLEEAVTPLYVKGQLTGYAMIGQFRTTDRIDAGILSKGRKHGMENELRNAFEQLPCFGKEQLNSILGLFSTLMDYIVTKELVSLEGERIVGRVLAFIEEYLTEEIHIRDAAQFVGQSVSTVSHRLKRSTGKTFTQLLNEARVQRAEERICQSPECSIQEIAGQVGYGDPFYFSRVYRKFRGITPSHFRDGFIAQEK